MTTPKLSTDCQNGYHKFIVSRWVISSFNKVANAYTCENCLLTIEGGNVINDTRNLIHAKVQSETTIAQPVRESVGSKKSKGDCGQEQKTKG